MGQGGSQVPQDEPLVSSLLPLVLGSVTDVVFQNGLDGRVAWISASVSDVLGLDPSAVVGRDVLDLIHPDDRDHVRAVRAAVMSGSSADDVAVRFPTASSGWRSVTAKSRPLLLDGQVVGTLVTLHVDDASGTRRALATVQAGNEVLVRSTTREALLADMRQARI